MIQLMTAKDLNRPQFEILKKSYTFKTLPWSWRWVSLSMIWD